MKSNEELFSEYIEKEYPPREYQFIGRGEKICFMAACEIKDAQIKDLVEALESISNNSTETLSFTAADRTLKKYRQNANS